MAAAGLGQRGIQRGQLAGPADQDRTRHAHHHQHASRSRQKPTPAARADGHRLRSATQTETWAGSRAFYTTLARSPGPFRGTLPLSRDSPSRRHHTRLSPGRAERGRVGPGRHCWLDHARLKQLKPGKEARDRSLVPHGRLRPAHPLVHAPRHFGHLRRAEVAGRVRQHRVASGRQGPGQPGRDVVRVVGVGDKVQDDQQAGGATGSPKSSVADAARKIAEVSRRSASR